VIGETGQYVTASDVAMITGLILLIPKLVEKYLSAFGFTRQLRVMVIAGGVWWITFSFCFGLTDSDAGSLMQMGMEWAETLESKNYATVVKGLLGGGNESYATYQGIIYYTLDSTIMSMLAINAFMAFWGSLTLIRAIYSGYPKAPSEKVVLPLFLIFMPSVVYWSSTNLKEALLYWAVCQILTFALPWQSRKQFAYSLSLFLVGGFIGMLLRPHTALIWFVAVFFVKMFQPRFWKYGICIILLAFLYNAHIHKIETNVNLRSLKGTISGAEVLMKGLILRGKPSTFDYGKNGPIPVVSGAINTFFRPFIWRVNKLSVCLSSLEIWTISLGILFLWGRMTKSEWKCILHNPIIQISLLVLIPFSFLFSYFPNEGLIARQRLQLFPALLVLFATPILQRRVKIQRRGVLNGEMERLDEHTGRRE